MGVRLLYRGHGDGGGVKTDSTILERGGRESLRRDRVLLRAHAGTKTSSNFDVSFNGELQLQKAQSAWNNDRKCGTTVLDTILGYTITNGTGIDYYRLDLLVHTLICRWYVRDASVYNPSLTDPAVVQVLTQCPASFVPDPLVISVPLASPGALAPHQLNVTNQLQTSTLVLCAGRNFQPPRSSLASR